jgi:hypothetical protein
MQHFVYKHAYKNKNYAIFSQQLENKKQNIYVKINFWQDKIKTIFSPFLL